MKKVILILMSFMSFSLMSQDFNYKFKIQDITNLATAKEITDPLRDKFKVYPAFKDSTDTFEFASKEDVKKNDIVILLAQYNYTLIDFKKSIRELIIKEEEKEE